MARFPLLVPALAAYAVFAASPLASADSDIPAIQPAPQVSAAPQAPAVAMGANMASMSMCGDREQVVGELQQTFSEAPMAVGQVDGNAVVEIFASSEGSWTILATGTDGVSCIISAGDGFESTTLVRGVDA
jgi:hypothetical protein